MTFPDVMTFIGGLAVLLFGMRFLIDYLCRLAGSKLAVIIDEMTSSPVKGLLWGTGITALVQSSGVVTVSLVGLVNAGILRLRQAIAVIMGANIGTTLTAWLF
ncbi:MAG: Na/Pi symporter, partial [Clostridia bacterium]